MAQRARQRADRVPSSRRTRGALIAHLFSPVQALSRAQRWKERRDRALIAVFLGGGLKTGEAAALTVSCATPRSPWITIDSADPMLVRRTRLAPFASAILDAWLAERAFGRARWRSRFCRFAFRQADACATMLRAVDALVDAAGIAASRT